MQNRPDPADLQRARQVRLVAIVLAGTMLLWMGAQVLGGQLGLETRYVFLFDLLAIAGFVWALVVTYQIWRGRRS
ncbi:DUF5337 domain-containing protein [Tabrizicola flagellatus]|uniref:DUF5337 domain-containing protein n=1 Tax=Tabrizicola flagellatus TaxID=2593021 RepID=UPI0011F29D29|nr:DUF5337 domain-containing protein [Tabrizicola flagellatus]